MRSRIRHLLVAALAISAVSTAATVGVPPGTAVAASVPAGFTDAPLAAFSSPTAVEWLPDDRIVVLEKGGRLAIGNTAGSFATAYRLAVCTESERGLLGFTHDPGFLGNGHVYVYYTHAGAGGCVNRVSRLTLIGDSIVDGSELVLLDDIASVGRNHNGGDLDIGADGFLYVSVGDSGTDPRGDSGGAGANDAAQDLSLLNGKILRITLDGQPAPGNPISGPGTAPCAFRGNTAATPRTPCQEIFAYGLRNPYRIAFDRNDGSDRFFINDVGQDTQEEVDLGRNGANYGWPIREGNCPQGDTAPCPAPSDGLVDPITSYGRGIGRYVTAGAFVPNGRWPSEFDGGYLFGDGGSGAIWLREADGTVDYGAPFATGAGGITDMTFGFDPAGRTVLYYVQVGGALRVITPTAAPASSVRSGLRMVPVSPVRVYDTGADTAVGVAPGPVVGGTTRVIDTNPPADYEAALVNLTFDATRGPGFMRAWTTRGARPATSVLNSDAFGTTVANMAIVPLAGDGTFVIESSTTARVIVDVMAWLDDAGAAVTSGRFVPLTPQRVTDTRLPSLTPLPGGDSNNAYGEVGDGFVISPMFATGGAVTGDVALVLSVAAIGAPDVGGFVAVTPYEVAYDGTSNVNVTAGDVRANTAVVPVGDNGQIKLVTKNVPDVVVDLLGYITNDDAPTASTGLYSSVEPTRVVDTRIGLGFGPLPAGSQSAIVAAGPGTASAMVQNVTVTGTSAPGWLASYPATDVVPLVSSVNFTAAGQTRASLAFTKLSSAGRVGYTSLVPTDLVVDITGFFS